MATLPYSLSQLVNKNHPNNPPLTTTPTNPPLVTTKPTLGDGKRRTPLTPEDIQADAAIRVDVWMIDSRREGNLGRLERVVRREVNRQEKHAALVGGVRLGKRGSGLVAMVTLF